MYVINVKTVTYRSKSEPASTPTTSAIVCHVFGNKTEKPTKDGSEKSSNVLIALDRDPIDLAKTMKAGINKSINQTETRNTEYKIEYKASSKQKLQHAHHFPDQRKYENIPRDSGNE